MATGREVVDAFAGGDAATVVGDATVISVQEAPGETVAFLEATVEGQRADAVLRVVAGGDEPATELTMMIRPLRTLLAGVKAMERALA